ncbi:MAG TPA: aquaporin [Acidimicrobiia bacterium]
MQDRVRIALAEGIGTMILVVGGPGTAILATGSFAGPHSTVGVLGVALAFGLSLLCAAYAIGSISGCHINPAVTIGLWAIKKTEGALVPFYLLGQIIGGIVGAAVIFLIADSINGFSAKASGFASNGYGSHSPSSILSGGHIPGGFGLGAVIAAEIFFTAIFVFVIASTSRGSMTVGFTGLTVGLMLTLIHLISIPIDNTSVNPARSIATAVFQGSWALDELWVFIVFPVIGGLIGALVWRGLVPAHDR